MDAITVSTCIKGLPGSALQQYQILKPRCTQVPTYLVCR